MGRWRGSGRAVRDRPGGRRGATRVREMPMKRQNHATLADQDVGHLRTPTERRLAPFARCSLNRR